MPPTPPSTRRCRSASSCRARPTTSKLALDICRDLKVPIVPRGGGTSQCGQTVGAGLVIDHSKHVRNVLEVDVAAARPWSNPASCWTT
jgi:FAD/FMN-containing dehydrogenase